MKKRYDRRRFLKKAAAAAGVVAGFAGLKAVPSGAKTPL
jgi:phosphodiesterase/alkaline phosphatase D-like protein